MRAYSLLIVSILLQGVLGLRLLGTSGNADTPKTTIKNAIVQGPWNNLQHHCKADKLVDSGFGKPYLCKDGWESLQLHHQDKPCTAYDIGVRDVADFALTMIEKFGCKVRAYDPSETTAAWWDGNFPEDKELAKLHQLEQEGRYNLRKQAAGGTDGDLKLYAYNWQQISTFRATEQTRGDQKEFIVQSKTLQSMMQDNGDDFIDVLKIDIEGSEFAFLNQAFDKMGCPPVEHMLLEWHSTDLDMEYGAPPQVKEVESKMYKCGYKKYGIYPFFVDKNPTSGEKFHIKPTYYGHAAYCKNCVAPLS